MGIDKVEPEVICPLCPLSRQEAGTVPTEVVGPLQGPAVGTRRVRHRATAHRNCIIWCPEVSADENGHLMNVDSAVSRAKRIKCRFCGERGASIGCWEPRCSASYHLVCAYDPECDVDLILPDLELWCPKHAEGPTFQAHEEAKREARAAAGLDEKSTPELLSPLETRQSIDDGNTDVRTPPRDANGMMQFGPRGIQQRSERMAPPSGQRHFRGYPTESVHHEQVDTNVTLFRPPRAPHQSATYTETETRRKRGRPRRQHRASPTTIHTAALVGTGGPVTAMDSTRGASVTGSRRRTRETDLGSRATYTRRRLAGASSHSEDDEDDEEEDYDEDDEEEQEEEDDLPERARRGHMGIQRAHRSNRQLTLSESLEKYSARSHRMASPYTEESTTIGPGIGDANDTSESSTARPSDDESALDSNVSAKGETLERDEAEWKWELERRQKRGKRRPGDQKASKLFSHILADVTAETVKTRQQLFQPLSGEALQRFIREAEPYTTKAPQDYELREEMLHLLQELPWIEARPNLYLCERDQVLYFYTRTDVWGWYADIRSICGASHPHTIKVISKPRPEHRLSIYLKWTKPGEPIGGFRFTDPFNTHHAFRDNIFMMKWILNGPFKRTRSCDLIAHGQCYFPELPTARLWFSLSREIIRGLKPIPTTVLPYRAYLDTAHPLETNQRLPAVPARNRLPNQDGGPTLRMALGANVGATTVATATVQAVGTGASPTTVVGSSRSRLGRLPSANWMVTRSIDGTFVQQCREHIRRQGYGFELDELEGADASSEEEEVIAQIVQRYIKQMELIGEPPEPGDRFWPLGENTDPSLCVLDNAWKVEAQQTLEEIEQPHWARLDALFHHDPDNLAILPRTEAQLREKYGHNYTNAVLAAMSYNRDVLAERQALLQQRFGDKGIAPSWNTTMDADSVSETSSIASGSGDEQARSVETL
ncbi:hypothetical protein F1559_001189 [Cyanidiococcus yangmingshanensis]|uniref:PHD-type domain-containing protein n=1 Tax=Cyanidiococcus yangmingshanensis TaxID=2690220 RepID=A0A7J7IH11_9RHOD|nr:hypothetical protein F1559_001189 [Cyanidiococcus yangmingshanensis]